MSAPFKPPDKPIWVVPCGHGSQNRDSVEMQQGESSQSDDHALHPHSHLDQIIVSAKNALSYATSVSIPYVKNTFNLDFNTHHESWKQTSYPWLPKFPKGLGEKTPDHHLSALAEKRLELYLIESFRNLQTIAVGLEQIHLDKVRFNEEFSPEFLNMQYKLRQVLCEVQTAIEDRMPETHVDDVDRSVMTSDFREMSSDSFRRLRDWLIFRDFMNCLEYLIEVCEFFKSA